MRWTLLTLAMLLPLPAWGQSAADCTAIENKVERIGCYRSTGDWFIHTEVSNFDDSVSIFMSVFSNETVTLRSGQESGAVMLISCIASSSSISISGPNMYFVSGFDGYGYVKYRVDDRPAGD